MTAQLECPRCGMSYPLDQVRYRCDCGGQLDVSHDLGTLRTQVTRATFDARQRGAPKPHICPEVDSGVWRYHELILPVPTEMIVSRPEGNTPLYQHPRLSDWVGVDCLLLKHEGENPSGSFKDRGMTVGVTQARWLGARAVACASTGNTSASLAAYAALAGLPAIVFIPQGKIAAGKLAQALAYGAHTLQVAGDFDDAMRLVQHICDEVGIYLLNSLNPFRLEGQKSIVFEIIHGLNWQPPDWIVLPAGNLGNTAAFGKALHELRELGLIARMPRLAAVQATGANPFYQSYQTGFRQEVKVRAETIATAIRIGAPVSYERAVRSLRWTDGLVTQVSDAEIMDAKAMVDRAGIGCEPASAAAVAGARKLVADGTIRSDERVVAVLTGNLLKDPGATVSYHTGEWPEAHFANQPRPVSAHSEEVRRVIESIL
ncbi:MAG: threonine synthase [Ardenticatenia bacterium]|nr:MAG: threonine synthase [Ardenticatenia bacterium]